MMHRINKYLTKSYGIVNNACNLLTNPDNQFHGQTLQDRNKNGRDSEMNRVNRFETISKTATKISNSWTNREIAMFHYFNPNGLLAQKNKIDKKIDQLVDAGKAKSGAIMAYGGLNFFYYDQLSKLIDKKSVRRIDLAVTIQGLKRDIEKAEQYIEEKSAI